MNDFDKYLTEVGEIGFVDQILHSMVYVSGLPGARSQELVVFETGDLGQVFSLEEEYVEILLFSDSGINVGMKVTRSGRSLGFPVGEGLLGRTLDPLGRPLDGARELKNVQLARIDKEPEKIISRRNITKPLETGVKFVDMVVPLGKGQRELVIGDRKSGKSQFLLQTLLSQAAAGSICIFAQIGQKRSDIKLLSEFLKEKKVANNSIVIASSSSDPSGLIYLTPYSAMAIADYFCSKGIDVLLILDDMTTHARTYREISLLSKRFPGRSSYPGDIFYLHAKLIERAGSFEKGSITLLPVAESILGDLSGYIQTNLMSMTDGHIFFDINLYNEGKRPAVNPFLSVTRVGHQTQTPLLRDASREISSFLVTYEQMKQFLHFGAEIGKNARDVLNRGEKLDMFFDQPGYITTAVNLSVMVIAGIWAGIWSETDPETVSGQYEKLTLHYNTDGNYKNRVDELIASSENFLQIVTAMKRDNGIIMEKLK